MEQQILISPLQQDQISPALALVRAVFDEFEAPDYAAEGVQEFYRFLEPDNIARMQAEQHLRFWGAFADDVLNGEMQLCPSGAIYRRCQGGEVSTIRKTSLAKVILRSRDTRRRGTQAYQQNT